MDSIGGYRVKTIKGRNIKINEASLIFSHYPVIAEGSFVCSDATLNRIYEVGKHTTKICRQTIELDSPNHQENLGCTGDYFVESLIAYYCFGDTVLSRFDIIRTAEYMRMTNGKMFHISYCLIWVFMLYDYYMFSGDKDIFYEISDVLEILIERFNSYIGDAGVIENPPNYMFIDWIPVEEYNLHHPPKALGQAALTAFYYHALCTAAKIYEDMLNEKQRERCAMRAQNVKVAFNMCFYDNARKIYFDGLNTPYKKNKWLPENTEKRYYSKHTNTLAVLFDLCDDEKQLMEKVMNDKTLIDVQPYFMHFVLEALYKAGLFEKYGLSEMYRWKELVDECDKGMKEAWGDYPGYRYDYSHAWGATPTYQLPSKLLGLKILVPGFKEISLKPDLFGLDFADVSVPTPYGMIRCSIGEKTKFEIPDSIQIINS